jgi:hypothetical protein
MAKPIFLFKGDTQTGRKKEDVGLYLEGLVPEEQKSKANEYGKEFNKNAEKWTKKLQGFAPSVDASEDSKNKALYKAFLRNLPEINVDGRLTDSNTVCRIDPKSSNTVNPAVVHGPQNKKACEGRLLPGIKNDAASVCKKAISTGPLWGRETDVEACKGRVLTFPRDSLDRYSYAGQSLANVLGEKVKAMMDIEKHGETPWHEDNAESFHLEVWGAYKTFADMDEESKKSKKHSFYINWLLRLRLFSFLDKVQSLNERQAYLWDSFLRALDGLNKASTSLENFVETKLAIPSTASLKIRFEPYQYKVRDTKRWPPLLTPQQQVLFCRTRQDMQELPELANLDVKNMLVVETQWLPERLEAIMPDNESRSLDIINFLQYFCTIHKTETEIFQGWWLSDSHILLQFFNRGPGTSSNPSKLLEFLVAHVLRMTSVSVFLVPLRRMDSRERILEHLLQATAALETWGGRL